MDILRSIPTLQEYHNFVDKSSFYGIQNGKNILSNIFVALPAFYLIYREQKISFLSINILLLAISSAYYHVNPSHNTIFMDMIFVISLNTIILSYFVDTDIGFWMYIIGILSVFYWKLYDNILPYEFLKIVIPMYGLYSLYGTKVSNYIIPFLGLTILIRYSEYNDKKIYKATNKLISGHSLKHILGGIDIYIVILVLQKLNKV
mgnify:FL=1|tara:strand:- start:509 stop:1120 length:612 start_codon:yes stop_codon:yes gene_type:complete